MARASILVCILVAFISTLALADPHFGTIGEFPDGTCTALTVADTSAADTLTFSSSSPIGAAAQCVFYSDNDCTAEITGAFAGADTSTMVYVRCGMSYKTQLVVNGAASNPFIVRGEGGASMCGDPNVYGFNADKFKFNGDGGNYYKVFSNEYVVVNTLFKFANADAGPFGEWTTVSRAVGVNTKEYAVTVDVNDFDPITKTLTYYVNGASHMLTADDSSITTGVSSENFGDSCMIVTLKADKGKHHSHSVTVVTHKFTFWVYISESHDKYIDTTYLDYFIAIDTTTGSNGGVLGVTAGSPGSFASIQAQDYQVSSLTANTNPSDANTPLCIARARQIVCRNLPLGHACQFAHQCASYACSSASVCVPAATRVCAQVEEHQTASLTCPDPSQKISVIDFASYGLPQGTCGSYSIGASCHATSSLTVATNQCVGQNSCNVWADNGVFTDPCYGTFKALYIQAECSF